MFFDLNVADENLDELKKRELFATAIQLGYSTLCTNRIVIGEVKSDHYCRSNKINFQNLINAIPGVARSLRCQKRLIKNENADVFKQLKRLTVVITDVSHLSPFTSSHPPPVLSSYDIVAVRPTSSETFNRACSTSNIDIISLNFSENLFSIKSAPIAQAITKGVHFEICYSPPLQSPENRIQFFSNVKPLMECTRGRNMILTSGASSATDLRSPYDVINFSSLLGMKEREAMASLSQNCIAVLTHGGIRRDKEKSCIPISKSVFDMPTVWETPSMEEEETPKPKRKRNRRGGNQDEI